MCFVFEQRILHEPTNQPIFTMYSQQVPLMVAASRRGCSCSKAPHGVLPNTAPWSSGVPSSSHAGGCPHHVCQLVRIEVEPMRFQLLDHIAGPLDGSEGLSEEANVIIKSNSQMISKVVGSRSSARWRQCSRVLEQAAANGCGNSAAKLPSEPATIPI